MVEGMMEDVLGVQMSVGTVNNLRQEASQAVAEPVEEAHKYVQQQPVVNADETGFVQGNADGGNTERRKGWLWVAVTQLVTVFLVQLSRGQEAARTLLGAAFSGRLISDRWNGYNWVHLLCRQLCWAHLKREFTKIAERGGQSKRIGQELLEQEALLFAYWRRVRDGTLKWSTFKKYAGEIRRPIKALLEEGADYCPAPGEQSERARTGRTCRGLLKLEPAMWLFVRVRGIEPTNNAAERALRHAVLWRRTSFGTQSVSGSVFVARMLTVIMTLRAQKRNVLEYLTQACQAARVGQAAPSLLPNTR
jgi:transposase